MRNGTATLTKVILATILKVAAILVIALRVFQATSCNNQDMMHDLADDNSSLKRLAMALLAVVNLCLCYGIVCSLAGPVWFGLVVNYAKNLLARYGYYQVYK